MKKYQSVKIINNKLPEEDVEYTFVFPGKKYMTFIFVGVNEKGRAVLMNVKTKRFTNMTLGYFNYLVKKQLINKKKLEGAKITEEASKSVQNKKESPEEEILRKISSLTPAQAFTVYSRIGYTVEELVKRLKEIDEDTPNEVVQQSCRDMMYAYDVYLRSNGATPSSFLTTNF